MSIVTQVQTLLNDVGVFWPQTQVLDAINEAQFWIFTKTKWARVSTPLSMVRGQDIIPIPSTILIPGWIEGSVVANNITTTVRMFPTTQRELEHFLRTWRGAGLDQPIYFSIWDATHLRIFPRPDQSYTYTLWGVGWPMEITNATSDIVGSPSYTQAIQYYSAAILFEATRPDLADIHYKLAEEQVQAFLSSRRRSQSHNIRRLRPARRLDIRQSGAIQALPVYYPVEC